MFKNLKMLVFIIIGLCGVGTGVFIAKIFINSSQGINTLQPSTKWLTYSNSTYGYSFKYPQDWDIDLSEQNSTQTDVYGNGSYDLSRVP